MFGGFWGAVGFVGVGVWVFAARDCLRNVQYDPEEGFVFRVWCSGCNVSHYGDLSSMVQAAPYTYIHISFITEFNRMYISHYHLKLRNMHASIHTSAHTCINRCANLGPTTTKP